MQLSAQNTNHQQLGIINSSTNLLDDLISLNDIVLSDWVNNLWTASTAMGESSALFWDTTLEQVGKCWLAFRRCDSLSEKIKWGGHGGQDLHRLHCCLLETLSDGWVDSLIRSLSAASRLPAITTTDVVPSPASMSWALLSSTNILAAGVDHIHLVQDGGPVVGGWSPHLASWFILSMPLGPG